MIFLPELCHIYLVKSGKICENYFFTYSHKNPVPGYNKSFGTLIHSLVILTVLGLIFGQLLSILNTFCTFVH